MSVNFFDFFYSRHLTANIFESGRMNIRAATRCKTGKTVVLPEFWGIECNGGSAQCSRMHLWQNFFFGLHAYFWKIQVILWCRNPFLEFFYYIDYGFLASYFWHFFLPFCNFYYWKVTNLALIEKKELCRQVWDLFWVITTLFFLKELSKVAAKLLF